MIKFDIITVFPQLFTEHLNNLPFKKSIEKKLAQYKLWDLKEFSVNNYGSVDGETYGGGVGMVLSIEPIYKALCEIYGKETLEKQISDPKKNSLPKEHKIIVLSPRGRTYNQKMARGLSKCAQITLICGRYEGIDSRVEENLANDVISIGDFVLSGGELAALSVIESITRILPGVLEKESAAKIESFSEENEDGVEYPQYTRPENFMGIKVPPVLLNGNHKEIEKWRKNNSKRIKGPSSY
jgi:tRNA (guanine37-N1)-methyltransferase